MANRLTAKDAAKKTLAIKVELANQARLLEEKNAQRAKEVKRLVRLQLAQNNKIIISAIHGNDKIKVDDFIVNPKDLSSRGFLLYHFDAVGFKIESDRINKLNDAIDENHELYLEELSRLKSEKISKERCARNLSLIISEICTRISNHPKFIGLPVTIKQVTKRIKEKIRIYKSILNDDEMEPSSFPGLYIFIFDSSMSVYQPIPELRNLLDEAELSLRNEIGIFSDGNDATEYEPPADTMLDYYNDPSVEDYKILLSTNDMSGDIINPGGKKNYFQVEWADAFGGANWDFDEILNAESLNWLSSRYGQYFFRLIEQAVDEAIKKALNTIFLEFDLIGNLWAINTGGGASGIPRPDQTAALMRLLGYEVRVEEQSSSFKKIFLAW